MRNDVGERISAGNLNGSTVFGKGCTQKAFPKPNATSPKWSERAMLSRFAISSAIAAIAVSLCAAASAQSVKTTIPLSGLPEGLAVNYVTNRIYVAIPSFGGPTDSLAVIDGKSDTVIDTISIPPIGYQVAVDPRRSRVYVGGCYQDDSGGNHCQVAVVDARKNKVTATIPVTTTAGNGIQGLAVNFRTGTLYVANASDNVIDVIRCKDRDGDIDEDKGENRCEDKGVSSTISLSDQSPQGIAVDSFSHKLYVALSTNLVDVINTRKNTVTETITVGETNANVAVNLVTGDVFVTNGIIGLSTLGVLSKDGTVLANVPVGDTPFGVDVDPFTNLAFVTNTLDGTVSVVDGKTNATVATLPVSGNFVGANPLTAKVYVANQANSITVISEK